MREGLLKFSSSNIGSDFFHKAILFSYINYLVSGFQNRVGRIENELFRAQKLCIWRTMAGVIGSATS